MYLEGTDTFIMSALKTSDSSFYISQYDGFHKVCARTSPLAERIEVLTELLVGRTPTRRAPIPRTTVLSSSTCAHHVRLMSNRRVDDMSSLSSRRRVGRFGYKLVSTSCENCDDRLGRYSCDPLADILPPARGGSPKVCPQHENRFIPQSCAFPQFSLQSFMSKISLHA